MKRLSKRQNRRDFRKARYLDSRNVNPKKAGHKI